MIGIKAPRFPARERVEEDAVVGLNPFNEAVVGEDGGLVVVLLFSEDGTVTMMSGRGVGRFVFFLYCIDTRGAKLATSGGQLWAAPPRVLIVSAQKGRLVTNVFIRCFALIRLT